MFYVVNHKSIIPDNELPAGYKEIRVGSNSKNDKGILTDADGDSICSKNSTFCETTALYWLWKNLPEADDFIGLVHYRRLFLDNDNKILSADAAKKIIDSGKIIVSIKAPLAQSVYDQYKTFHLKNDMDVCYEIVKELYPEYENAFSSVLNQDWMYICNIFACNRKTFNEYCQWLFPILMELEKRLEPQNRNDSYQKRAIGFLSERLFNVWLKHTEKEICELNFTVPPEEHIEEKKPLQEGFYCWNEKSNEIVSFYDDNFDKSKNKADLLIVNGYLEKQTDKIKFLTDLHDCINQDGRILLYTNNRLALKYFCGEKDPFTNNFGDSLENYLKINNQDSKLLDKKDIENLLNESGWKNRILYSVFPDIQCPQFLIKENYIPAEKFSNRLSNFYNDSSTIFLDEEYILDSIVKNNLLPQMADGFLFELSEESFETKIEEVTLSCDRGKTRSMATLICNDNSVIKKPVCKNGMINLLHLQQNLMQLKNRNIKIIDFKLKDGEFIMPYCNAQTGNEYLRHLLRTDKNKFLEKMDLFVSYIKNSSESFTTENGELILTNGLVDMVPLNSFAINDDFIFFDQEYEEANYPAAAIITRSVHIVYELDADLEAILPKNELLKRYGLLEKIDEWNQLGFDFISKIRNRKNLSEYLQGHEKSPFTVCENRHRLNYSERDFEKFYYNPLAGLENKIVYVYGKTEAGKKFIEMYEDDYDIKGYADENNFDELLKLDPQSYRIVICTPNYDVDLFILKKNGFSDVVIYKENHVYPGRQATISKQTESDKKKPYKIGYVAGVFDLFHVGHLNLLRRAKEQCEYLIVGVVTDEGVIDFKKTNPVIHFNDRIEIIRSCKYVDEAIRIPYFYRGTIEAFEKYHFDVQFSGSDYENNPLWLKHKEYLQQHGANMVFFGYTQGISSSQLKSELKDNNVK